MESHGVPNAITLSDDTHALVKDRFACEERPEIAIKGKGVMTTYLLKEQPAQLE